MIRQVKVRNFKRFREEAFDLADAVVLAGPNNGGKSTLLQAIATWKSGLDRWTAQRSGGRAVKRAGVAIPRADFTAVPLREMNLLWEDRKVTGPRGMSDARLIEIFVEGRIKEEKWTCGLEFRYANPELVYVKPRTAGHRAGGSVPEEAKNLDVVHVPPLAGIERDEPRRDRGLQDLLVGQGRPGEILRNLLLEISENGSEGGWESLVGQMKDLFEITLSKPSYAQAQPYIVCEYREKRGSRSLDLSNAGSGTLQVLLLLAFLHARPASVILLDEPDAHQHVILQRQVHDLVRRVAREKGGQIIVATHSEVVLNATDPTRVIAFVGDAPRQLANERERDQLQEALKRLTTTDLLLGRDIGNVLYTEGESDANILAEWARIRGYSAQHFLRRPFVHRLGGRSINKARDHLFALQSAFPDIRAVCLLDGDNRGEPDEKQVSGNLLVLRWRRYEIENYLLHPDAIKRFVNFQLMDKTVDDEFYKLVQRDEDLFGNHVALTRVKASDEFLIPLLKRVDRVTAKRDLHQLAGMMTMAEINPEVWEKLDRINEWLRLDDETSS